MITATDAKALDDADPLGGFRERFDLPGRMIYLDGNSLGVLPKGVRERVANAVDKEWGQGLISSWAGASWIDLPKKTGDKIAKLIGAAPGQVVVGDSTSVNLYKCLVAALKLNPGRRVIVSEEENFPTDNYIIQGAASLFGATIRYAKPAQDPAELIGEDVAVLLLTQVNYRTAAMHDMKALTTAAHKAGALVIWDLSHSTGAVPVDVTAADADFAVGCTYKYLNGGPGAPAFVYAAPRLVEQTAQPLSGWMGHKHPFAFVLDYEPGEAMKRYICGTPHILSLTALEAALDIWTDVDMAALRTKSLALTDLFMALIAQECGRHDLKIVTPRDHVRRGSHVSISYENGYPAMRALASRGVVGDFRAPDLMRFGFTPLYTSYTDVFAAAQHLKAVLDQELWRDPAYAVRLAVT